MSDEVPALWVECERCSWYLSTLYRILGRVAYAGDVQEQMNQLLTAIHERIHRKIRLVISAPYPKKFHGCEDCDWLLVEICDLIEIALKQDEELKNVAEELVDEVHTRRCQ